jgi:hypothetical protein
MFSKRQVPVQVGYSNLRPCGALTDQIAGSRVIYSESRQTSLHDNNC